MSTQCHLTWDSYKKNICEGFSHLQQQEELVDMTLAAEGHLVKVHKTLLALASPYLKSIIQSAPCQHPVVFLTNLKHQILGYILEFVYTGEVELPVDEISDFIAASKALHINGASDLTHPTMFQKKKAPQSETTDLRHDQNKHKKNNKRNIEYIRDKSMDDHGLNTGSNLTYQEVADISAKDFSDSTPILYPPFQNTVANKLNRNIEDNPEKTTVDYNLNTGHSQINTNLTYQAVVDDFEDLIDSQVHSAPVTSMPIIINTTGYNNPNNTETLLTSKDSTSEFLKSQLKRLNSDIGNKTTAELNTENETIPTDECEPEGINQVNNINIDYDMDIDVGCTSDQPFENKSDTNMVNVETNQNNNYSINVEMPLGNEGPPKITIQAEVLQNLPIARDSGPKKRIKSFGKVTNSNIPKIIIGLNKIHGVKILDVPGTSTSKDDNILGNIDKTESASNDISTPYYIMSSKGSLQIILNRFMYGLHHQAQKGKKIRWRCIDYRHHRCPAYIDTSGEIIVSRKFAHCHAYHDDKIMNRGSTKKIYDSLQDILRAQEEQNKGKFMNDV